MGDKDFKFGATPPEEALLIKTIGPWDIYYSPGENAFYIQTEDYHALPLKMLKSELLELLADVERTNELILKEDSSSAVEQETAEEDEKE